MFKLEGILDDKFLPDGSIIRMKSRFSLPLNSEDGVLRFIEELKPFAEIKITEDKEDKTQYFLDKYNELRNVQKSM